MKNTKNFLLKKIFSLRERSSEFSAFEKDMPQKNVRKIIGRRFSFSFTAIELYKFNLKTRFKDSPRLRQYLKWPTSRPSAKDLPITRTFSITI